MELCLDLRGGGVLIGRCVVQTKRGTGCLFFPALSYERYRFVGSVEVELIGLYVVFMYLYMYIDVWHEIPYTFKGIHEF